MNPKYMYDYWKVNQMSNENKHIIESKNIKMILLLLMDIVFKTETLAVKSQLNSGAVKNNLFTGGL